MFSGLHFNKNLYDRLHMLYGAERRCREEVLDEDR